MMAPVFHSLYLYYLALVSYRSLQSTALPKAFPWCFPDARAHQCHFFFPEPLRSPPSCALSRPGSPFMLHCSPAAPLHALQCWLLLPLLPPLTSLSLSLPTLLPPFDEAYFPVQYPHRSHWGVYLENVVLPWKTTLFTAHPFLILLLWGLCASHCLGATLPLCKLWITNSNAKVILIYRYANNSPCPSPNPIQKGSFIFVNWFAYN